MATTTISGCICRGKTNPELRQNGNYKYPTLGVDGDAATLIRKHGYFVVRGLISQLEVNQINAENSAIIEKWLEKLQRTGEEGNDWDEIVNRDPAWKEGKWEPEVPELGVRRLFRMAVHNEFFAKMAKHEKIVQIVTQLIGADVKLIQSMSLLKPPGSAQKKWHQDNAYFRLTPCKFIGVWIALDPARCDNGCMHVLPSSHGSGFYKHSAPAGHHIDYGMVDLPNPNHVVPVILNPGDAMVFHGEMAHYTPPNVSNTRRRSLQLHYASSECKPIKCPKPENVAAPSDNGTETNRQNGIGTGNSQADPGDSKPHYFDCDPSCEEAKYWYFRKGEMLVAGRDYGGDYV